MLTIRIPASHWGKVWRALVASEPISCIGPEPVYLVSNRQIRLLRRKKLPFELVPPPDDRQAGPNHAWIGRPETGYLRTCFGGILTKPRPLIPGECRS
jgi:hypothetical protein